MKAEAHDVAQTALAQVAALPKIPVEAKRAITAFLQQDRDDSENLALGEPQAAAHEFASQGLIDLLGKLEMKFSDQRMKLEKNEQVDVNDHLLNMQELQQNIDSATQSVEEKSEEKAKSLQSAADARGNEGDATATRDADMKYLADLTAECTQKANDFERRQELRAGEIEAIEKATEILAGGAVAGAAEKHLPDLMQMKSSSFAQLR